jgi:hypothetical protein
MKLIFNVFLGILCIALAIQEFFVFRKLIKLDKKSFGRFK